jgi:Na+/H+-dicarboxylate symporter
MSHDLPSAEPSPPPTGPFAWYHRTPLYLRIVVALVLGILLGELIGEKGDLAQLYGPDALAHLKPTSALILFYCKTFSSVVLRLLGALATPLIFVAVVRAIVKTRVSGKMAGRLVSLLLLNTVVAILIGLLVANVVQPGRHTEVKVEKKTVTQKPFDPVEDLLGKIPGSVLKPLAENDIMSVILIALALGAGLRVVRSQTVEVEKSAIPMIERFLDTGFQLVMVVLHWIIALVPLAVFGVVAEKVGREGISAFKPLLWFVLAVLLALALQAAYYLIRLRLGSWVRPGRFLSGGSEALLTAFSTASSAATLPITFTCMREKIGVREESASLGVMVGGAFNHDGTALYEAMAAMFISQILGQHLGLFQQLLLVFMAVMASVGAAGIPEAGLVTMLAVFTAVRLPVEYIPMLLVVDWFLDRCRTSINVMGDMCVTCLLDGKQPASDDEGM